MNKDILKLQHIHLFTFKSCVGFSKAPPSIQTFLKCHDECKRSWQLWNIYVQYFDIRYLYHVMTFYKRLTTTFICRYFIGIEWRDSSKKDFFPIKNDLLFGFCDYILFLSLRILQNRCMFAIPPPSCDRKHMTDTKGHSLNR